MQEAFGQDGDTRTSESLRLQRRLRKQGIAGILLTAMVVGGIACYQFYMASRDSAIAEIQKDLMIGSLALGARLNKYQSITPQVTSRSRILQILQPFNEGKTGLSELRTETDPKLADAMRLAPEIIGIMRLGSDLEQVAQVGTTIPQADWPRDYATRELSMGLSVQIGERLALAVSGAIVSREFERVGTDLVFFDIGESVQIAGKLLSQIEAAAELLLLSVVNGESHYFALGHSMKFSPLELPGQSIKHHLSNGLDNQIHYFGSRANANSG